MRFLGLMCVLALLTGLLLAPAGAGQEKKADKDAGKNHTVKMKDNKFDPEEITIAVNDTITWMNEGDNTHTATADKKDDPNYFDTGDVKSKDKSKAVKFSKAGTVPYHCEHHKNTMKGTITVK